MTCELTERRDKGQAPLWDNIFRTRYWDVVHHFDTALPGWLVLVARRHIAAVDEMSEAEAAELGVLLRDVSLALRQVTGCRKTYVLQFADHPSHPHVHVHVVPVMDDRPEDRRGPKIMGYVNVAAEERVDEAAMNAVGEQVRQVLSAMTNKA
ncbi:MAG: HIT domain-containing protein [Anaerolineaceae bacterium]|nr:HIT domain-containing protein [Anaerolineaceae bacterium]